MTRLLIVTAVPAEAEAVRRGLSGSGQTGRVEVAAVGVGPAGAAAGTARLLALAEAAGDPFRAVISAGIAGGFPGRAPVGTLAIGTAAVAADLGAQSPEGFLPLDELGFGATRIDSDPAMCGALAAGLPGTAQGTILTVCTVTGTAETAGALLARYPDAVAEAMEGFGVATAAHAAGIGYAELRAISNPVGPRDRDAWQIRAALDALAAAVAAVAPGLR